MADAPAPSGGGVFGAVQAQLDQLSSRDRKLLAGLMAFFGLLFVGFVAWSLRGNLNDKASRVVAQKDVLEAMQDMQQDYLLAAARIEKANERLKTYGDKSLSAYLEETARKVDAGDELSVNRQQTEAEHRKILVGLPRKSLN